MISSMPAFNFHVLLEKTETGQTIASIAELANCRVEAATRQEALTAIQQLASDRLSNVEVLPLQVPASQVFRENPWIDLIGIFEEDSEFLEITEQLQAERDQDTDDRA